MTSPDLQERSATTERPLLSQSLGKFERLADYQPTLLSDIPIVKHGQRAGMNVYAQTFDFLELARMADEATVLVDLSTRPTLEVALEPLRQNLKAALDANATAIIEEAKTADHNRLKRVIPGIYGKPVFDTLRIVDADRHQELFSKLVRIIDTKCSNWYMDDTAEYFDPELTMFNDTEESNFSFLNRIR
jgi:hypothetical protein